MAEEATDGFFWCGACKHVVALDAQQLAAFDDAPCAATMTLKCPRCRHYAVKYRLPAPQKRRGAYGERTRLAPVAPERAQELFAEIYRWLETN